MDMAFWPGVSGSGPHSLQPSILAIAANGVTRFGLTLGGTHFAASDMCVTQQKLCSSSSPPLHEQRRIAEVLDSIDEAIERAESVITSTEQLRDALLHDLLTKGVPGWHTEWKDAPNIGSIPACWEVARLGDVAEVNPRRPRALDTEHDTPVNFVPMAAVDEGLGGIQETPLPSVCRRLKGLHIL